MKSNLPAATITSTNIFRSIQLFLLISILLCTPGNYASGQQLTGKTFIVAPGGSDNNPGTMPQPFATLEAARDAARKIENGNHRIIVLPGEYYLTRPFELDSRDNGLTIEADTSGIATLYGGTLVTGWRRDGDKFWCADLPGVKEGTWDFRALVVNGRMPGRARIPVEGTFINKSVFDGAWFGIGGQWTRNPTKDDLTKMLYDPKDIPETLDTKNAEVRVYHSWNESLVGVAGNDIQHHELIFSSPTVYPPGFVSWGRKYLIYNTREGMTKPGQWYLDRTNGRLVYWPLEGEDMTKAKIIAPKMESVISIKGDPDKKAENITIRGLKLQSTGIPLKPAGEGGDSFKGGLSIIYAYNSVIEGLEISNVGGVGISAKQMTSCRIINCHIHSTGATGLTFSGDNIFLANNRIHNAGIYYPSAVGISAGGSNNHIYRNEIHDIPYCGMTIGRINILVEENLIYRVMLEMHDGAAIYAYGASNCIYRGNVARDIKVSGNGEGVSSYYLDEGSHDCIVENNVSINVERPTHNYIARDNIVRNNYFISDEDMNLSFPLSANYTFEDNTVITPGQIRISPPSAVVKWKGNRLFSNGRDKNNMPQAFRIDSVMPVFSIPAQKTGSIQAMHSIKAPTLDGDIAIDEWPGGFQRLDRLPSRQSFSGAPVMVKFSYDKKYLYIGALMNMFDINNISKGDKWRKDDGVEISLGGFDKGKPVTYVIRAYVNGTIQSVTDAGATASASERLGKGVRYVSKIMEKPRKGWSGEWAIPLAAIGLKPDQGRKVAFNMCAYINEYGKWHCWEGTLGETWQVDKAGILLFE
jgi:hypothetical protein